MCLFLILIQNAHWYYESKKFGEIEIEINYGFE